MLGLSLKQFLVDTSVTPSVMEEGLDSRPYLAPLGGGHANDSSELGVVLRQPPDGPIFHDQEKIGAVLSGR